MNKNITDLLKGNIRQYGYCNSAHALLHSLHQGMLAIIPLPPGLPLLGYSWAVALQWPMHTEVMRPWPPCLLS